MTSIVSEIIWFKQLISDFQFDVSRPTLLFCDNMAAIHIAENPNFHERKKHIELDCHFIREHVSSGQIKLMNIKSENQLADVLTNPLPIISFYKIISKMDVKNIHKPS